MLCEEGAVVRQVIDAALNHRLDVVEVGPNVSLGHQVHERVVALGAQILAVQYLQPRDLREQFGAIAGSQHLGEGELLVKLWLDGPGL